MLGPLRLWRTCPEVRALAFFTGASAALSASFMTYAVWQKPDVRILRYSGVAPHEQMDPEKPAKLWTVNQKYEKIPELEELRKVIGPSHV